MEGMLTIYWLRKIHQRNQGNKLIKDAKFLVSKRQVGRSKSQSINMADEFNVFLYDKIHTTVSGHVSLT